ncbi:hypothetical protein TIFTF001_027529 [Ficus carica]|uniref:RRM domain-containing protein n=1 Tax=Ficus carica TaxID=3494 RepID=A0AA88DN70_FICCA|nr:hypothetical protein TIFTF001_027529 [Ficus carica]
MNPLNQNQSLIHSHQQLQQQLGLQNQGTEATPPPPPPSLSAAATLLIRHLPEAIPEPTLSQLFSHFGSSSVRPCTSNSRLRNCAFVDFPNEVLAFQAQRQLNGLRFLGKVLKVEKASKTPNDDNNTTQIGTHEAKLRKDLISPTSAASFSKDIGVEQVSRLGSHPAAEPVAPRLGVDYPFPPHLDCVPTLYLVDYGLCWLKYKGRLSDSQSKNERFNSWGKWLWRFLMEQHTLWAMLRRSVWQSFLEAAFGFLVRELLLQVFGWYAYPPPDGNILTNIVNTLIAVPRFYTQVLHLMNKMNIPAPFRMAMPTPPLPPLAPVPPPPPPALESTKQPLAESSSEESEMESSDEEVDENIDASRPSRGSKRVKREAIVGPAVDKDVAHEAVGVKPATLVPKEIPVIKKRNPVLQIKIANKAGQKEHNDGSINRETEDPKTESIDMKPFATQEEVQNGKMGPEELLSLPVFRNYKAGNPASVLYIKNLAKDVVVDDFYYIFGSLFGSTDIAKSSLSVKLMQEGRMRGQAFVTFPSVELAHHALNLVNGYEFKGKPMVIQFGRNPAAAKEK